MAGRRGEATLITVQLVRYESGARETDRLAGTEMRPMEAATVTATRQLRPVSLRDQALAELRARLVAGALKPGTVYSAATIANELGVSNGPVREAMLALVNQGLLEVVRNKGFRVVDLTPSDRSDIAEIRKLLEIPSMVKLASSGKVVDLAEHFRALADELVELAEREDLIVYLERDRDFHLGLIDLLGNDRLTRAIGDLRDQTRQYGLHHLSESDELVSSAEEHRTLLEALIAGDVVRVEELMHFHLRHLAGGWSDPSLSPD